MSENAPSWVLYGGCLPRADTKGEQLPELVMGSDDLKIIDPRDWRDPTSEDASREWLIEHILSQLSTHMCASFGTCAMLEDLWVEKFGPSNAIILSPSSLYNLPSVGRARPGGSTIQSNVVALRDIGALPARVESNRSILEKMDIPWEHTLALADYSARPMRGADDSREHFRIGEVYDIDNYLELSTCPRRGLAAVYGRDAHAICAVWAFRRRDTLIVKARGSWGYFQGSVPGGKHPGGFHYDNLLRIDSQLRSYGGAAARSIVMTDAHQGLM